MCLLTYCVYLLWATSKEEESDIKLYFILQCCWSACPAVLLECLSCSAVGVPVLQCCWSACPAVLLECLSCSAVGVLVLQCCWSVACRQVTEVGVHFFKSVAAICGWWSTWFKHILFRHQQGKPYTKALKKCIYTIMCVCRYITIERNTKGTYYVQHTYTTFTPIIRSLVQGCWSCLKSGIFKRRWFIHFTFYRPCVEVKMRECLV